MSGWHTPKPLKGRRLSHYFVAGKALCDMWDIAPWHTLNDTHRHCVVCERMLELKPRDEEIRRRLDNGEIGTELAEEYGLKKNQISVIKRKGEK